MKNFFEKLSPFAPDYSGAASVFYSCGALVVICDPGGCSGNVCGYDEPRFYNDKGMIFSASLRDMDTIFGKDNKLIDKICSAIENRKVPFIALIGTPVVSVIATDLNALCSSIEKKSGVKCISVDTSGMKYYDNGIEKARKVLQKNFGTKYDSLISSPLESEPTEPQLNELSVKIEHLPADSKIIIIHQQHAANRLRKKLYEKSFKNVTAGSWFFMNTDFSEPQDIFFDDEEIFFNTLENFDIVFADSLFLEEISNTHSVKIPFNHSAVSGDLFAL